jgi:predicted hotdog family 3-hydroxylacyl-ACP dehydratase
MAPSEEINIPQKPPMVMVDRLLRAEGTETVTSLYIRKENVFIDRGRLSEAGLIENMAQTAAAGTGASTDGAGQEPRTGFIGGIKDLKISELPAIGEEIITRVTVEHTVFDANVVRAEITLNRNVIAACEMKIFLI